MPWPRFHLADAKVHTVIGEKASGSPARAPAAGHCARYLKDAPILILDEATRPWTQKRVAGAGALQT